MHKKDAFHLYGLLPEIETPYVFDPTKKSGRSPAVKGVTAPPANSLASKTFQGQRHPKNRKKYRKLEQWIEVRVTDSKTVTTLYPSNQELIRYGQEMLPPPEIVVRRINFPDGIPAEYAWVGIVDETHRKLGGLGLQRMTVNMWLEAIKEEEALAHGHIGPVLNLPDFRDECDCEVCRPNRKTLDRLREEALEANEPDDLDTLVSKMLALSPQPDDRS